MGAEPKSPLSTSPVRLARGGAVLLVALAAHGVVRIDALTQRIATTTRIAKLTPPQYASSEGVKMFNRLVVAFLTIFAIFFTLGYEYHKIVEDVEIPILGNGEAGAFGYYPPIGDQFLPAVPSYNIWPRYRPRTPLLIPFTRNNTMIRQAILSYVAGGWPRADILIVDNSGVMDSNSRGRLTKGNPFTLDYDLFRRRYGVSIIQTPTLLNFAQMQNFMLRIAIERDWPYYFWSHMDVAVLGGEEYEPYKSFYHRILDVLDASHIDQWAIAAPKRGLVMGGKLGSVSPSNDRKAIFAGRFDRRQPPDAAYQAKTKSKREIRLHRTPKWGVKFFQYDYLSLVNVQAWVETGQWDPFIPYYNTDCDFYQRMAFAGYPIVEANAGHVFDIADVVQDPEERFFPATNQRKRNKWSMSTEGSEPEGGKINSGRYKWLKAELEEMMEKKLKNEEGRNTWQTGGIDERKEGKNGKPIRGRVEQWTYEAKGFQAAWWQLADAGRVMYIKKWGTMDCDLKGANKTMDDMWLLQYAKEGSEVYNVRLKQEEHHIAKLAEQPIR
ncbi:hypothetical protein BT63DRAFT_203835 [Microthyrium microscopicum]|uniref:Uncharacterized protein n=1 Tax=Microthyrium microscopicum TaxID=703497 RepID=A0A6A6UH80_9PEZI|nr:hypothetical protein BT63DRAFT_203835 [Microthyrium microscopicum]